MLIEVSGSGGTSWPIGGNITFLLKQICLKFAHSKGEMILLPNVVVKFDQITLPETNVAHENPPFWWYLPGKMGIFMGYVSFREGRYFYSM